MTWFGNIIYSYRLSKQPTSQPYEDLSKWITWKIQNQCNTHDLTLRKWLFNKWRLLVVSPIRGWWFRRHYYRENGKIYNSLTCKYYYVHDVPGTYKVLGRPCCKMCKRKENTYPEYVLENRK